MINFRHVSEKEYSQKKYPNYCDGYACLYTKRAVTAIMRQISKTKYFWIDDVLFGGILAKKANVRSIDRQDLFYQMPLKDYQKLISKNLKPLNFIAVHTYNLDSSLNK